MGEANRRKAEQASLIWHHTSILRTNLIWMSGVIELEGRSPGATHPAFGEIITDATARRPMRDFPALAWFTSDINVPKCLQTFAIMAKDKTTGEMKRRDLDASESAAMTMNRMALGFPAAAIGATPWPEHFGYHTREGADLNDTARDLGDDPDLWWVTERPVDVLEATDIRGSRTIMGLKMERMPNYLEQVHQMVRLCRALPGTYIPPSWTGSAAHQALADAGVARRG